MGISTSKEITKIQINTLGSFNIILDEQSQLDKMINSYKMMALLKYFITFKEKRLLPEVLIDDIWPDNESNDPKSAFRTQIFRLRRILDAIFPDNGALSIVFNGGYYAITMAENIIIDSNEFEKKITEANKIKEFDRSKAIILYKEAIELYKGDYLAEDTFDWLLAVRNYYNRMYVKAIFNLIEMYKEDEAYALIIEVCERAMKYGAAEETLHIYFMEALLKLGYVNHALSHYEYITSWLNRELEVQPSLALKDIYRQIKSYGIEKGIIDIRKMNMEMDEDIKRGSLICDREHFQFLYNLAKRKSERQDKSDFIILITMEVSRKTMPAERIKEMMQELGHIVSGSVRKGDVYTFWNETQLAMIIAAASESNIFIIQERISKRHIKISKDTKLKFTHQVIEAKNNIIKILHA